MYHALRDAIIAEVRKHEAEGDCPTARSYGIEMLENVILDLAFASPTPEPSSDALLEVVKAVDAIAQGGGNTVDFLIELGRIGKLARAALASLDAGSTSS